MRVNWFVFAALMGLVPNLGTAQQIWPPGAAPPSGGWQQVTPEGQGALCPLRGHRCRLPFLVDSQRRRLA